MPIKSTTTMEEGESRGGEKVPKEFTLHINTRIINVFLESLLSESFSSLGITVHFIPLGCPPTLC